MRIEESTKKIFFEPLEEDIASTSIVELGGPLHSELSRHLVKNHWEEYKEILNELHEKKSISMIQAPLLLDSILAFFSETLEGDYGTSYPNITKADVKSLLNEINLFVRSTEKSRDQGVDENRDKLFKTYGK